MLANGFKLRKKQQAERKTCMHHTHHHEKQLASLEIGTKEEMLKVTATFLKDKTGSCQSGGEERHGNVMCWKNSLGSGSGVSLERREDIQ